MTDETPRSLNVLLVDDCPDTTGSLAMLLRAWGHSVEVARNGAEALAIAADRPVGGHAEASPGPVERRAGRPN